MSTLAIAPFDALTTHLDALINSLIHTNTFAAAPTAASSLVAADDALTSTLTNLKQHQQNYARTLHLRVEAGRLEEELKNIVRKAVSLWENIGRIHPSILDDDAETSDEEERECDPVGQGKGRDVDYHTLLNFAARIGKHNSLAAREAEQEAQRRKIDGLRNEEKMAGSHTIAMDTASIVANASEANATHEGLDGQPKKDDLELQAVGLEDSLAAERAKQRLSFPDGMLLRMGDLGRLQKLREDAVVAGTAEEMEMKIRSGAGEEAVEREIERLIRETEVVAAKENSESEGSMKEDKEYRERDDQERRQTEELNKTAVAQAKPRMESPTKGPPVAAAPKRRKINRDFGGDDDDDD